MDEDGASLSVGFVIEPSYAGLLEMQRVMDSTEGKILASTKRVEQATGGMINGSSAVAQITAIANAATKAERETRREKILTEQAIERAIKQIDREASAVGRTKEQQRAARVEELALAAARQGNTDAADRLAGSYRRLGLAQKAIAEDRLAEETRAAAAALRERERAEAAVTAQLMERSRLEGALQRITGANQPRATEAGATFSALAAQAAEEEARAVRQAAIAHQMFEARVRQGVQAMKEHEAAQEASARAAQAQAAAAERLRAAIDPAYAAQQRFNREMAEARALVSAGAISLDEYVAKLRMEQTALDASANAKERITAGAGQMRQALQGASFQVQDLITQVSMGTNPINALAVQGGQLAGQFALVEGKAGAVGRFLIGPWGLALTAATMVAAPFIDKLIKSNNALDDAVDKLKKDAKETEANARAKEVFGNTVEGVTAAIHEQKRALDASADSHKTAARRSLESALANQDDMRKIREKTAALYELAAAQLEAARTQTFGAAGGAGAGMAVTVYARQAEDLRKKAAEARKAATVADSNVERTMGARLVELARERSTAEGRINAEYDKRIRLRERELVAAKRGNEVYAETLRLEALRSRDLDRAREAERGSRVAPMRQSGRNIDLSEARGIVESVGGRVTSDLRSRATQQRLYDKYMAYKAGTGPWAALAAKPGTSNHELGQAIDVAKGQGVSLQELVKAFRARGVQLTEFLDEGSHYHLAWKKVGAVARQESAAQAEAAAEQREALRNAKRLAEERKELMDLANRPFMLPNQEENTFSLQHLGGPDLQGAETSAFQGYLDGVAEQMRMLADQANVTGNALAEAFGRPGAVLADVMDGFADYQAQRAAMVAQGMDEAEMNKRLGTLQARNTAQAISGVKSLFKEKSTAFKVMSAIEKAYAAWQAAETIASMVRDTAKTVSAVANSATRATAAGTEGIASQSKLPFPYNIAAMAATGAALIAAGVAIFGGGGGGGGAAPPPSAEDLQKQAGAGTVLGDSKAKSESIARSLELVAANTNRDLEFSNDMLKALRSIDTSIARMAGTVARQVQISGGLFDTSGQNLGTNSKKGFLGLFGGSTTTRSLYDLGMTLDAASVGSILAGGVTGSTYQTIEAIKKKKGFLGIGGGTKTYYDTTYGTVDPAITSAIQGVVRSLRDGLVTGANLIGLEGASAILDSIQVNLGKISFKDMTGAEIEDQLNAVFSSIGDTMAGSLLPSLGSMQEIGEGLFETFMRVAKQYQSVDVALQSIGRTFGAVGLGSIAARDALVKLFDGLDGFIEATDFFRDQFLTEAEQMAPIVAAVRGELGRLGLVGVTTREQFKQAVLGLDLTTVAGREMYASLMKLAPAYDKVIDYQEKASKASTEAVDSFRRLAEGLRKYRDTLFGMETGSADAYVRLRNRFADTTSLAAQGDKDALGRLESDGKAFLEVARANASTYEQYQRDVALVARGVDAGIVAADEAADYAQLQLDALKNAVSILTNISVSSAATAAALQNDALAAAAASTAASAPASSASSTAALQTKIDELIDEMAAMRAENNAGLAAIAGSNERAARTLEGVTAEAGGNAFAMTYIE